MTETDLCLAACLIGSLLSGIRWLRVAQREQQAEVAEGSGQRGPGGGRADRRLGTGLSHVHSGRPRSGARRGRRRADRAPVRDALSDSGLPRSKGCLEGATT